MNLALFESKLEERVTKIATPDDPAHDILHFKRVVATAKYLAKLESARMEIVVPAAWLHDFVIVPKNDPRRSKASRMAAEEAVKFLGELNYPTEYYPDITHAIEAHSYSAGIEPKSLEAKIVQDSDRLDGLGAMGIARCFATAGIIKRALYSEIDPLCEQREPDDQKFTIDHFFKKLFKTVETLQTESGRAEGRRRAEFMRFYLQEFLQEIRGLK